MLFKVALLQSVNSWAGELGASVHCKNDRSEGDNTHEGSGTGTMGAHGEAMTSWILLKPGATNFAKIS